MTAPRIVPTEDTRTSHPAVFFTREAWRRLWRARRTSSVAVAMIAIALFILGFFLLLAENLGRTVGAWNGTAKMTVYMRTDATAAQIADVNGFLSKTPQLTKYAVVTREEALRRFRQNFSSLSGVIDQLDENPFPISFDVQLPENSVQQRGILDHVAVLKGMQGVDDVQLDWAWIARVKNVVRLLNLVGLIAGGVLAVAAAFTTANVIRLSLVLYRDEISIMRLVGANESMIRGPFLIQGLMQGFIGGVCAVALLAATYFGSRHVLQSAPSLLWNFLFVGFLPPVKALALVVGGTLAGLIGSWVSLIDFGEEEIA